MLCADVQKKHDKNDRHHDVALLFCSGRRVTLKSVLGPAFRMAAHPSFLPRFLAKVLAINNRFWFHRFETNKYIL